jgi:cytochrome c
MSKALLIALTTGLIGITGAIAQDASSSSAMPSSSADMASSSAAASSAEAPAITGDAAAGKTVFGVCAACHAVGPGAANKVGPELNGLIGRKAGTAPNYRYSAAMTNSGLTWDVATFQKYIADPKSVVPGNKMSYAGLKDAAKINDLTAYLASFNADGASK